MSINLDHLTQVIQVLKPLTFETTHGAQYWESCVEGARTSYRTRYKGYIVRVFCWKGIDREEWWVEINGKRFQSNGQQSKQSTGVIVDFHNAINTLKSAIDNYDGSAIGIVLMNMLS